MKRLKQSNHTALKITAISFFFNSFKKKKSLNWKYLTKTLVKAPTFCIMAHLEKDSLGNIKLAKLPKANSCQPN